jgi:hypothetical protein
MPAFEFVAIVMHRLPDGKGWGIYGIRHNSSPPELIALLKPVIGQNQAERIANDLAKTLAGTFAAEVD